MRLISMNPELDFTSYDPPSILSEQNEAWRTWLEMPTTYNLFKCWRYIPDRNIKKSGHGSNLRRGYQRFGDSSWNENFSSNIFIHTFIHVHPFSVHHFIPAHWHPIQVPSLLLTSSHDRAAIAHGSPVLGQGIRALCGVILIPPPVTPARWMDAKLRFMTYLLWTPQLD